MEFIKNAIRKLYPELEEGHHLPKWGVVERIPGNIKDGQLSTEFEPGYAVDIKLLDKKTGQPKEPIYESVPLPVDFASHNRGKYGFPQPGTRVLVQFVDGNPKDPVITHIYPLNLHMPALDTKETLMQHSPATYLRTTQDENVDLRARNKIRLGNKEVDVVAELHRLSSILESHTHPKVGTPVQSAAIANVTQKVGSIKT